MQENKGNTLPICGYPWTPYLVFLRRTDLSDGELLSRLGKSDFTRLEEFDRDRKYLAIGRDSNWIHIADNYYYEHWGSKSFRASIQELARETDVFTFSLGDIDMAFDFELYRDGDLVRRFVWVDPTMKGGYIEEEFGDPIPGEESIPFGKEAGSAMWNLAALQGIETDYTKVRPKLYAGLESEPPKASGWWRKLFGAG